MDESVAVYVPSTRLRSSMTEAAKFLGIAEGSGIVGSGPDEHGRVLVDYEGSLYARSNVVTFADRVFQAWGRHSVRYPTIARSYLPSEALVQVGEFWPSTKSVAVAPTRIELLEEWLGTSPIPEQELRASS